MRHINPLKTGIAVGAVIGFYHFVWACLVALGWAQPFLEFVLRLHMIDFGFTMAPFALGTAAALVALTSAIGFAFGFAFALVWNFLTSAPEPSAEIRHGRRAKA